ncbi:DUF4177 domain-containing protein [Pseudonocardia benzenivorans]
MTRYEYRVLQLRESMIGGKLSADKLEKLLNDEAGQGWQLKAITSTEVKGGSARAAWRACWSRSSVRWAERASVRSESGPSQLRGPDDPSRGPMRDWLAHAG